MTTLRRTAKPSLRRREEPVASYMFLAPFIAA
jgi:hypothetical protein